MDAFYAAVEVREDPALAGKPLIIGHRGRRGVVATASYEARRFGIHSAMPSVQAARLCPHAVWRRGRHALYVDVSKRIRALFEELTRAVEPLSIDEAFLDLTGIARSLDEGADLGRALKDRITEAERLTASVGVAGNKFLAKVASDMQKPDGLVILAPDDVEAELWPLPVDRLWGVGQKTRARLEKGNLHTVHDIAVADPRRLEDLVGARTAGHLQALSRGEDHRAVVNAHRRKSLSEERTYTYDLKSPQRIDRALVERASGVATTLQAKGWVARTVHLKVRTGDYTTFTRSLTLSAPTNLADDILSAARSLLASRVDLAGRGVRLVGVGASGLSAADAVQGSLFETL